MPYSLGHPRERHVSRSFIGGMSSCVHVVFCTLGGAIWQLRLCSCAEEVFLARAAKEMSVAAGRSPTPVAKQNCAAGRLKPQYELAVITLQVCIPTTASLFNTHVP